jgi:hypothetical protein
MVCAKQERRRCGSRSKGRDGMVEGFEGGAAPMVRGECVLLGRAIQQTVELNGMIVPAYESWLGSYATKHPACVVGDSSS